MRLGFNRGSVLFSVVVFFSFFLIYSCDDASNCQLSENRTIKLKFIKKIESVEKDSIIDSLMVVAINTDSVLYKRQKNIGKFNLTLSVNSDTCGYILEIDSVKDTIMLGYTSVLVMVSSECGFNKDITLKKILSFSKNRIDTVTMVSSAVNIDTDINLKIYLSSDTSDIK
jgi:hypothetical protein